VKRNFWCETALLVVLPTLSLVAAESKDGTTEQKARAIHQHVLTVDSHVDVLLPSTPERYYAPGHTSYADLEKIQRGGVDVVALAIAVGPGPKTPEGLAQAKNEADEKLKAIQGFVKDNGDRVALALSSAEIERIHREGKVAVITSFLNARSIGADLSQIDVLYKSGVRIFGFVHAGNNDFADSSRPTDADVPPQEHHGLSPLGKEAVAKLNYLGVIIDVSQLTPDGVMQTLQLSKAPVIASHSAARALVDNPRNLSDAELDAIKANGGVVHVTAFNPYLINLPNGYAEKVRALRTRYGLPAEFPAGALGPYSGAPSLGAEQESRFLDELSALGPKASLKEYIDHIDYIVKRIGIDHVGIGSDFNHGAGIFGFHDESEAFNVTRELVRRDYSEEQIAKIWGGNFLRVFAAVESEARQLQSERR
jgi:membrane dipeptidase